MGEVVVSSEGGMELQVQETGMKMDMAQSAENKKSVTAERGGSAAVEAAAEAAGTSSSAPVVKWERFLPKMAVRVLLVEADDSTRQIIAALLRKCSYKVAAVPDGLKAWEVLKGRSQNIDLILTEVELPSISGYALLTLIMEHDNCKNIPVIMMSSHDSVNTAYKCMLRGAADFLVKPIRKNELGNLWQHVWRRQASKIAAGPGPPEENVVQETVEATAENNAVSNHSSGYMACVQRNRECIEKGSDAQSSCTKPDLETEAADTENLHLPPQPKSTKSHSNMNVCPPGECHQESREKTRGHNNEAGDHDEAVAGNDATTQGQDKNSDNGWEQQVNMVGRTCGKSRVAIDLIGAFDNNLKGNFRSAGSNASTNKFDIFPILDLSLRRSHPTASVNQANDETPRLNHSDASAFSRYINKPLQNHNSTSPSTCNQPKEQETNSEKQQSNYPDYNSDAQGQTMTSQKHVLLPTTRPGPPHETTFPYPQKVDKISHPIPVRGVRVENLMNGFNSAMPQIYSPQSPMSSPGTANHSNSFNQYNSFYRLDRLPSNPQQFQNLIDQRISPTFDQTDNKLCQKMEKMEDRGHVSPGNEQSGSSNFYNGYITHHHSTGCGSNGNINSISAANGVSEYGNEESFNVHDGASHRSLQREAALTKFRLKRKDRCFEKKVRYESRKKLAEQRPRVKGQFVRQAVNEAQPGSSSAC